MKKRLLALLVMTALLAGLLSACAGQAAPPPQTPTPPPAAEPTTEPEPLPTASTGTIDEAIFRFSEALFREVLLAGEENPVISPLSAYYALAMVALGTRGDTRAEFEAVLGLDPEALAAELRALSAALKNTSGSTDLSIAGSIWTADGFTIASAFAEAMRTYFDAPAHTRDFASQATVDEINAWIAERTEGLIEEMIDSISRDEVMLLINTLYFSAKWAQNMNPMTELLAEFHPATGNPVEVPFLFTGTQSLAVSVTDTFEAVMLPYDDGRLGLLLVRPTDGTLVREFAATQNIRTIIASLNQEDSVQVRMPRLDLEFELLLNDLLKAMGLEEVFGDFADLSGLLEEDERLRISSVRQKVRLLVDEEGTEAAAVTVVGIERMSIPMNLIELTFDTPYFYVIYDLETGVPLFMGVLDNPA
ncbi:MAG: serpin family protein [Oscillospiraceae bacterium]|nr:serpin family protein [Oscillospiraceae bacterium]